MVFNKNTETKELNGIKEVAAGVIVYRRTKEGPKFLLLYRGGTYWSFPKGKLGDREGNFRAAIRETGEETGLPAKDLKFGDWFRVQDKFIYTRAEQKVFKTVTYFLAETKNPAVRIKIFPESYDRERHEGYGWFLYRDALRMLRHESLRKNLKKAYELVTHRPAVKKPLVPSQ